MVAQYVLLTIIPALFILAAVWDVFSYTIPNSLILVLLSLFVVFAGSAVIGGGMALSDAGFHLLSGVIGLAVGMALFAGGFIGGGDAKLFAVAALWLGINSIFPYALLVCVFGGLLTIVLLSLRRMRVPLSFTKYEWVTRLLDRKAGIPYGVALAAGALIMLPRADIFRLVVGS
jgi:prepilin peptidase CpaA